MIVGFVQGDIYRVKVKSSLKCPQRYGSIEKRTHPQAKLVISNYISNLREHKIGLNIELKTVPPTKTLVTALDTRKRSPHRTERREVAREGNLHQNCKGRRLGISTGGVYICSDIE